MHPVGFEPTISAGERPKTYALDRAATGTGSDLLDTLKTSTSYSQNVQKELLISVVVRRRS